MGIQESDLHLLNKSTSTDWKSVPTELGGGVTAFFEGFHQIHCLVSAQWKFVIVNILTITESN